MNQSFVNVACMGENGKNSFIAKLLGLYNSNNLNAKYCKEEGWDKVIECYESALNSRKETIDNNMPIIWNLKLDKKQINIYSIENEINDTFNNSLVHCKLGLFYINYKNNNKTSLETEFKNQILLSNILGIKTAIVYLNLEENTEELDISKITQKIRGVFTKRNYKSNRVLILTCFDKQKITETFKEYFKLENRKKQSPETIGEICLPVSNIFNLNTKYFGVNGTLIKGTVSINDFIINSRTKSLYKIEELQVAHKQVNEANTGNSIGMKIKNANDIGIGDILVHKSSNVNYYTLITAQVLLIGDEFDLNSILTINTIGHDTPIKVINIQKTINNLNKTIQRRPEKLKKGDTGIVIFQSREKLPLKLYSNDYTLGSFLIKTPDSGIIGVGIIKGLK